MPDVELPDGRVVEVPDDATPEQLAAFRAKLARDFPNETKAALQKKSPASAPAPKQQGNPISRGFQALADPVNRFAQTRQIPRAPQPMPRPQSAAQDAIDASLRQSMGVQGAAPQQPAFAPRDIPDAALRIPAVIAGGALQFGADFSSKPVATLGGLAESLITSPRRALEGAGRIGPSLVAGDVGGALKGLGDALMAGTEFATAFYPPLAGAKMAAASATRAIPKPTQTAVKRLMEADPKLAENAAKAKRFNEAGIPATTADLTTRNAQSRLKGAARRDGPAQDIAQDVFDTRQADQGARLTSDIQRTFGVDEDFLSRRQALEDKRKADAGPLYKEAHASPTKMTPALQELMKRPPVQKALADADELAAIDGITLSPETNTQRLHYAREALDEQIDALKDPKTGKPTGPRAAKLINLRKQFNEELRRGNPAFAKADEIWSGGMAAQEALDNGVRAAGMTTEREVRSFMRSRVKPQDRESFELGFAQGLTERIGKSGSDGANQTLKLLSPENQKIVRAVLGKERGEQFLDRVRVENLMARARQRISPNVGSDTAENLQQSASQAVAIFADVMRGNLASAATGVAKKAGAGKLVEKMQAQQRAVDEQLLRLATEDPDRLISLIQEVSKKQKRFPDVKDIPAGQIAGRTATATALAEIEKDRR